MTKPASTLMANDPAAELLDRRMKRVVDTLQLRQPDCVPIFMPFLGLLPQLEGVTNLELYENPERAQAALERAALRF